MEQETLVKRAYVHADGIRSPSHDRLRADRDTRPCPPVLRAGRIVKHTAVSETRPFVLRTWRLVKRTIVDCWQAFGSSGG